MDEPDLNLLIALDALLTDGSVVGAARRLGLSTSAMSRTLTRLRTVTQDPLLVRAGRRMVLTPGAEALRERTRHAVSEARTVLQPTSTEWDIARLERTFTIRANDGFVEAFGPDLIAAVYAAAPRVRLRFAAKPEKTTAPLRDGSADLEIGVVSQMGPEVRTQALFRDRFIGVVRKGHPLEGVREVSVAHYLAYGHVIASRHDRKQGPVDIALAALGVARTIAAIVPSFPAALAVARASDLIALLPASFLSISPANQGSAPVSTDYAFSLPVSTAPITISQMWHPRLEVDPVHRWLRQLVLSVCQQRFTS